MPEAAGSQNNKKLVALFDEKIKKQVDLFLTRQNISVSELRKVEKILNKFTQDIAILKGKILIMRDKEEIEKTIESIKFIK